MGSEESNSNEAVREAELLIQKLNELGHGEQISDQEFLDYYERLPSRPRRVNLKVRLEDEGIYKQEDRHGGTDCIASDITNSRFSPRSYLYNIYLFHIPCSILLVFT
jgi:hypothetical protein